MLELDPWDPGHRSDPHTFWNQVREAMPVAKAIGPVTGRTFTFLTRYDDCVAALRSGELGKEPDKHLPAGSIDELSGGGPFDVLGRSMLFLDPPDHTRLRRLVRDGFSQRAMRALEPRIEEITHTLVDALHPAEEVDLIADFALPLPITVIGELLGIPPADQTRFRRWTEAVLRGPDQESAMAAGMEFVAYLNGLADERRASPQTDLLSFLVHVEEQGDRLSHAELLAMVFLLLIAGHETTVNLIGNGTLELSRHPDQRQRLVSDLSLVPTAVEEMLRFHGPVESATLRWSYGEMDIAGDRLGPGDLVIVMLMAANRDPRQFPDPDRFEAGRSPNRHIAFGSGIHHCLGAPLARIEAQIAFRRLLERFPRIDLAVGEEDLAWNPDFFLRGLRRLPVILGS